MLPILYQTYAALAAKVEALNVISNNLANANSAGYKSDQLFEQTLRYAVRDINDLTGNGVTGVPVTEQKSAVDFSAGPLQETNNPLHLALAGDGFFCLQTAQGERYTRRGDFVLNAQGQLQSAEGLPVLGEAGPLQLPPGQLNIDRDGQITVDGALVGRLKIVDFQDRKVLRKEGLSHFAPSDPAATPRKALTPQVKQGALEGSNVNSMQMIAELLTVHRQFDSLQQALKMSMTDMTGKLIEEAARR